MFPGSGRPIRKVASLVVAAATVMLLASCSLIAAWFGPSDDQIMRDKMAHIIEAINDQDSAALREMFTDYALAEYSAEIDEGIARLLSLFPNGDVIWRDDGSPSGSGSGSIEGWKKTWRGGISDLVISAGNQYTLGFSIFTENTIDPENVGIFRINVDPRTENQVSGAELASCGPIDTDARAGGPPGVFIGDGGELSKDRANAIVAALNAQDAVALKSMFTEHARTEYSAQIDEGIEFLLAMFAGGEVTWGDAKGGSAVCERINGDARTVLLPTYYTVRSGGVDYRLFFADFTQNTIDPDNVGIYAIGAELASGCGRCVPESDLNDWASEFYIESSTRPGIYMSPTRIAGLRMEQIAAALNTHDAAALKGMFSNDVLENTPDLDERVDYLLSLFPNGGVTWELDLAAGTPIEFFTYVGDGKLSESVQGNYKLSADGIDYWLFFSDTTVNESNPNDVGLESLGATPWFEERHSDMPDPEGQFWSWTNVDRYPGIYVPE